MRRNRSAGILPTSVFGWMATLLIALVSPATAQMEVCYGGHATAAVIDLPSLDFHVAYFDTSELPRAGGVLTAGPGRIDVSLLRARATSVRAAGLDAVAESSVLLQELRFPLGGVADIRCESLQVSARASFRDGAVGETRVGALSLGGVPIFVTGEPDQIVVVPAVGTLTINEQYILQDNDGVRVMVNGLHLSFSLTRDQIVVGSTNSRIECGPEVHAEDFPRATSASVFSPWP